MSAVLAQARPRLMNILLRLYDLESGGKSSLMVKILRASKQERLRAHIGVVSQDTSLLHRSIADNIAYGNEQATRNRHNECRQTGKRA